MNMIFSFETSDLRAVLENTTPNVDIVSPGSLASGPCECEVASKNADDAIETDSEVPSTFADEASENEASEAAEGDTTPNADIDSPASWFSDCEFAPKFADDDNENESEVVSAFTIDASENEDSDDAKVNTSVLRVVIKKTFLHFELFDEDCSEIGLNRRISCRRHSDILYARDSDAQTYKSAMEESTLQGCQDKKMAPDVPAKYIDGAQHPDAESNADSSDINNTWINDCSTKGIISVGSVPHFQGLCRPCVWFWRPEACKEGVACKYCHLCDENAVARAVAAKRAIDKQKRKLNKARGRV